MVLIKLLIIVAICYGAHAIQVNVTQGIVEGTTEKLVTGDGTYLSFKGIPYAAPPIGPLRFLAPTDPPTWTGVRNASAHGSICLQQDFAKPGATLGSEDCLFLNVYTPFIPKKPKKPLAVMVFIHGGGFISGSGNVDFYGPDFIVPHNVVLVTLNYRLGPFGFLTLNTAEVPGNAAFKDQVAALKWVQLNIRNFGGDPRNVTIFGQSTGAASVCLHMLSQLSAGYFHRVLAMSGGGLSEFAQPFQPERRAFALGHLLGFDTTDKAVLLSALQNVTAAKLVSLSPNVIANEEQTRIILKKFYYTYVIESAFDGDHFIKKDPLDMLKGAEGRGVDFMIGHTNKEALSLYQPDFATRYEKYRELFAPDRILDYVNPSTALKIGDTLKKFYFGTKPVSNATYENHIKYFSDTSYNYDIYKFMSLLGDSVKLGRYMYQFSAVTSRNIYGNAGASSTGVAAGAGHMDDVFYLFDPKQFNLPINTTSPEYKVVQQYSTLITNFAKFGNPTPPWITNDKNLGSTVWPKYTSNTTSYLDIGNTGITAGTKLDSDAITLFDSVYKDAGIDY